MNDSEAARHTLPEMSVSNGDVPQGENGDATWTDPQVTSQDEEKVGDKEEDEGWGIKEDGENKLPVDHGWAWLVMLGQFTITLLMVGYGQALSIVFLEFRTMFNISVTVGTVTFAVTTSAFGLGNLLVTNVLLTSENSRKLIVVGSFVSAACISLSSVSPNIAFLLACHFFMGMANAASYIPSILLVGHYFSARRAFATSVGNAGVSVAFLVFPPLTQFLMTSYGTRGAILLTGGVCMQAVIMASICRPVTFYNKGSVRRPERSRAGIILKIAQSRGARCGKESLKENVDIKADTDRVKRNSLGNSFRQLRLSMLQDWEAESARTPLNGLSSCVTPEVIKKCNDTDDVNGALLVSPTTDISTNLVITTTTLDNNTSALDQASRPASVRTAVGRQSL